MIIKHKNSLIISIIFILLAIRVATTNENYNYNNIKPGIRLDLTPKLTMNSLESSKINFYKEYYLSPLSSAEIFIDLNMVKDSINDFGFSVVQFHSYIYNVSVIYNSNNNNNNSVNGNNNYIEFLTKLQNNKDNNNNDIKIVNGTNIGLILFKSEQILLYNPMEFTSVQVAVTNILYTNNSTIPGRQCCTSSNNDNFPNHSIIPLSLNTKTEKGKIIIDAILSKNDINNNNNNNDNNDNCLITNNTKHFSYEFHYLQLNQGDISSKAYFKGIKAMLTVDSIKRSSSLGKKKSQGFIENRREFIIVPGTGLVFNFIVKMNGNENSEIAHVPTVSYFCHPDWWKNDCRLIPYSIEWVLPGILLIILGVVRNLVTFPNRLHDLFFNTFAIGLYFTFCLIAFFGNVERVGSVGIIIIAGMLIGFLFCGICSGYDVLHFSLDITSKLIFSWLIAVFIQYLLNDNDIFDITWIYWTSFCGSMLTIFLTTLLLKKYKRISLVIFVVTAASAFLAGVQILLRSNMLFIIFIHLNRIKGRRNGDINGVLKPTAEDLAVFVTMPTFIGLGIYFQLKRIIQYRYKDSDSHILVCSFNDKRPLARVISRWTDGSDDVFETPRTNRRLMKKINFSGASETNQYKLFN